MLHDAVPDAMEVTGDILLVEGNYFQIGEGAWAGIGELADETVYISAPMGLLRDRLVGRKLKGGSTQEEAEAWTTRTSVACSADTCPPTSSSRSARTGATRSRRAPSCW